MERTSDAELMARVKAGDQDAFAQVIDRYKDGIVNFLSRLTGSLAQAQDLAQETFLRLYYKREGYTEAGKLSGYLYRIATNLARSEHRRDARRRILTLAFLHGNNGSQAPSTPQTHLLKNEIRHNLKKAIEKVPLRYRVPLLLHTVEGLTYNEVAEVLGCREGTVKSRISRGRACLKSRMAAFLQEDES
ncbi:MAG: RNA polymerase sigma factor [Deltaproteobacteria bacterium]|nr:RNA polymerase sigma factor [Deltaproteobacteria bacterium]